MRKRDKRALRDDSAVQQVRLSLQAEIDMCMLVLNLSGFVSRGGCKETSIWRDVTRQNSSLMSLHVLEFLPALNVPHLVARRGRTDYFWSGFYTAGSDNFCICVCVQMSVSPSQFHQRTRRAALIHLLSQRAKRNIGPAPCDPEALYTRLISTSTPKQDNKEQFISWGFLPPTCLLMTSVMMILNSGKKGDGLYKFFRNGSFMDGGIFWNIRQFLVFN